MSRPTLDRSAQSHPATTPRLPALAPSGHQTVLNAYALSTAATSWQVQVYQVERLSPAPGDSGEPRDLTGLLYQYARRAGRGRAIGPFWGLDDRHVAAPVACQLPAATDFQGYRITPGGQRTVSALEPADDFLVQEILKAATREALRTSSALGELIQDGYRFVEAPAHGNLRGEVHYCRQYEVRPKPVRLAGGARTWTLQLAVNTVSLGTAPLSTSYQLGQVETLAGIIRAKRKNRRTRLGEATAIRVLYRADGGYGHFGKLTDPDRIFEHAERSTADQRALGELTFPCEVYLQGRLQIVELPGDSVYLVLDTQITGEGHDETILDVPERLSTFKALRSVVHGHDAYGVTLNLEPELAAVDAELIRPPALLLRGRQLDAPTGVNLTTLQDRIRARSQHVKRHGYLHSFVDINPLVAVPRRYGQARAEQLMRDLQAVIDEQGLELRLAGPVLYDQVEDIQRQLGPHDALIAVLPEGRNAAQHAGDMHEQIKRRLSVTSQCVHHDNTRRLGEDGRGGRSARFNYQAVILNLLVKHGWVPFLPAEPGHYNVRFGIDVGGILNNKVMACLGYGFSEGMPIFRAEEILVGRDQAEPILDGPLYLGLNGLLTRLRQGIVSVGIQPNFNRVLFFRDGDSNGQDGLWEERDAFRQLHAEFRRQGWVDDTASWVLVEISKRAQDWRQLRLEGGRPLNPLIGTVSFPFDDPHRALLSTTGSPTLSQGTAQPLLLKMSAIAGTFDPRQVAQDVLWEADLCFTKLDHGYTLPFTLHVADAGALQLSRTYQVSGLTV